jgi:thiol-disulfide isomerase/thioredoxin
VVFLGASTIAFSFGASTLGWTLALIVAALAAAAATTGICVGCEMYVLLVRLRGGVRVVTIEREESELFDAQRPERKGGWATVPAEYRTGQPMWLVFTTEFCAVCPLIVEQISAQQTSDSVLVLNVAEHLDLASSYKVRRAPTVVRADVNGTVIVRLAGADSVRAELDAIARESVTVD